MKKMVKAIILTAFMVVNNPFYYCNCCGNDSNPKVDPLINSKTQDTSKITTKKDSLMESTDIYGGYYRIGPEGNDTVVGLTPCAVNSLAKLVDNNIQNASQNNNCHIYPSRKIMLGELYRKTLANQKKDDSNEMTYKIVKHNGQFYKLPDLWMGIRKVGSVYCHVVIE